MSENDPGSLTRTDFLVLAVLMDEEAYAYRLSQEINRRTGARVTIRPGNLYRVIDRLERRGLIHPSARKASSEGPERQFYRITKDGAHLAATEARMVADIVASSPALARALGAAPGTLWGES